MELENKNGLLQIALHYLLEYKWSIIPLCTPKDAKNCFQHGLCNSPGKSPLVPWADFQTRKASKNEVEKWWTTWPTANIGIVTGKISNLVVVDIEKERVKPLEGLTPTVISMTGGGGWHYYYLHPGGVLKNRIRFTEYVDFKADGGYVVAPPSLHYSEGKYSWSVCPDDADIVEIPSFLIPDVIDSSFGSNTKKNFEYYWKGVGIGERNIAACSVIGTLIQKEQNEGNWESIIWPKVLEWNQRNNPPIGNPPDQSNELLNIWKSTTNRELRKRQDPEYKAPQTNKSSQAEQLLLLLESMGKEVILFHDNLQEPYACISINDHTELWPCKSKQFKRWLTKLFWDKYSKSINSENLGSVITTLQAKATFDGPEYALENRVASFEDSFLYDLADEKWRAVEVKSGEWNVLSHPPIKLRRYSHQRPQLEPARDGDISKLLEFVNISDPKQKLLLLVFLVSSFIPDIPHVVLMIHGAQGSAKSFLAKILRSLIDPSALEVLGFTNDRKELAQLLYHHWCNPFDNISDLTPAISDILCKAVTGDGVQKRELYTDDEEIIYNFKRVIILNGINLVVTRADLLERGLLLELDRIPPDKRRSEQEVLNIFNQEKQSILGGIFDVLAKAKAIHPTVKLNKLPRMADFAMWACAISEALGYSQKDFLDAYYSNIKSQTEEMINASLIGVSIKKFMQDKLVWEGTATDLLRELNNKAYHWGIDTSEKDWPKGSQIFSRKLKELKTTLAEEGIQIAQFHNGFIRSIRITNNLNVTNGNIDDTTGSVYENGNNDTNTTTNNLFGDIDV